MIIGLLLIAFCVAVAVGAIVGVIANSNPASRHLAHTQHCLDRACELNDEWELFSDGLKAKLETATAELESRSRCEQSLRTEINRLNAVIESNERTLVGVQGRLEEWKQLAEKRGAIISAMRDESVKA